MVEFVTSVGIIDQQADSLGVAKVDVKLEPFLAAAQDGRFSCEFPFTISKIDIDAANGASFSDRAVVDSDFTNERFVLAIECVTQSGGRCACRFL